MAKLCTGSTGIAPRRRIRWGAFGGMGRGTYPAFFHIQHLPIYVDIFTIGVVWAWLVVGGVRLVRAGGGVPFRGADRRRTNRRVPFLFLTL